MIDLHAHSSASDGALSPAALVARAQVHGVTVLAITDHDTVSGVAEAIAAGAEHGLWVIPGIEISARDVSSVHVLGYFDDAAPEPLSSLVADLGDHRHARNRRILARLHALGMPLDYDEVCAIAGAGTVGRPHIAQALVGCGHVSTTTEAFDRFLADDRPAYVPSGALGPREAVELIVTSGGCAVLAHPLQLRRSDDDVERLVAELADAGLAGLEAYRPEHTQSDRERLAALAATHGVAATGGSDFHAPRPEGPELGDLGRAPDLTLVVAELVRGMRDPRLVGR